MHLKGGGVPWAMRPKIVTYSHVKHGISTLLIDLNLSDITIELTVSAIFLTHPR